MAVLQKLRTKFGMAISIIVGLGLLSFIIDPGQIESAIHSMSSKYDVGRIAGKKISYTDYQENVDKFTTINQIITGSSVQNEQSQKQIRDAAWQDFVDKYMFVKNAKEAGIRVGDSEMVKLFSGENPSPMIAQNPAFCDENGVFSVDRLVEFKNQMASDESGQLRAFWNYLQNSIYNQQYYAKYGSLFMQSNNLNALQLAEAISEGNTTANIDYVFMPYLPQKDTSIVVAPAEIKKYYNDHKKFFRQNASRDIEYVVFEVVPSTQDINETADKMAAAYEEFATADNMKTFLLKNSERSLSNYWYKAGELATVNADLDEAVFSGASITPIIQKGESFYAAKVMDSKMISDSVYVKHILLQGDKAASLADSLLSVVNKGGNFANLAAAYSVDQNSAADGQIGNIGWMTQNYMIPGFESVITAEAKKPFIITTQYGTHVVLVSEKTAPVAKKQVAILEKTALASKETFNKFYSEANTFATLAAGSYEGYKKAIDSTKVYSHRMNITEATASYGAIDQAKEVTRWAFDNKAGKASAILTVNNNYFFVAAVTGTHKEGYTPLAEVSARIEENLYADKYEEKYSAELKEKITGKTTMEQVAEALNTKVETMTAVPFSMISQSAEPALIGAAIKAEENTINGPVCGMMGAYIFKVYDKQTGEFFTEADARNNASQRSQYSAQLLVPAMMEIADVKDNRERFF